MKPTLTGNHWPYLKSGNKCLGEKDIFALYFSFLFGTQCAFLADFLKMWIHFELNMQTF